MKKSKKYEKPSQRLFDAPKPKEFIKKNERSYTGNISIKKNGSGKVVSNEIEGDIFIPRIYVNGAYDGDEVEFVLIQTPKFWDIEGKVVKILKRDKTEYVGEIRHISGALHVICDNGLNVRLNRKKTEKKWEELPDGTIVVIDVDDWRDQVNAHIIEVLGNKEDPHVSLMKIARKHGFVERFSKEVQDSLEQYSQEFVDHKIPDRTDIRHEKIFTIDPADAKDFDDAISINKLPDGSFDLGVHIADVSAYIPEGGPLDQEAAARGTSLYLPSSVIPMLPRKLSNYLCSLNPDVDRLSFSCFMRISKDGDISNYHFKETVMRSAFRFNYLEFQQLLDAALAGKDTDPVYNDFRQLAVWSKELKDILKAKRLREGGIEFELPEIKVVVDEEGKTVDIHRYQLYESNSIIEDFMLAANKCAAHFLHSKEDKLPGVYRIHEKPSMEKISDFFEDMAASGIKFKVSEDPTNHFYMQDLLKLIKQSPNGDYLANNFLRAMMKAKYSTNNIGHYGLAFDLYTHFTSPIRRYPDLMVHRLIKKHLKRLTINKARDNKKFVESLCMYASEREVKAIKAEYEARDLKIVEFMADKIGKKFNAVIVTVVPYGVYVRMEDWPVEGLVRARDQHKDLYEYDEKKRLFKGRRSGDELFVGKEVTVLLKGVSKELLTIDFDLVK
ncbi:MAG TPA: ribonuclease R [Clostridiales bacterium]|nr:ribonuclease R [Clostridiales bacterium]HQP69488.1 ribonuclease R [Clostridiales bacterium]